jgi:hypothetical protein
MWSRIKEAMTNFAPSRGICLILAIGMMVYGITLLLPTHVFAGSAAFALMAQLGSENLWGGIMLAGGAQLLVGVVRKSIESLRRGAFIGFILWGLLAVLGTITDPTGTGLAVRGTLALMHAYMYLQVKINAPLITGEIKISDVHDVVKVREEERAKNTTGGKHVRTDK